MRNMYFIKYVVIALFLIALLVAANNSPCEMKQAISRGEVGSSESEQSVSQLIQLIAKLTARIEALEERIQVLEVQIKALEASKGKSGEWHQVLRVIDGDTVELSNGITVRYLGIDSPEKPLGEEATEANRKLVECKQVRLEYDAQKQGIHGRTLAYVYINDTSTSVNCELLRLGYAEITTYKQNLKHLDALIKCQWEAIKNQRGIWKGVQQQDIVYITATGNKYHREWCGYLNQNAIPTTRERAIAQGYGEACKVCKP